MLDSKAQPAGAEGSSAPIHPRKARSLKREGVHPKENPEIVEGREKLREEALENLFSYLHVQKHEK